MDIQRQKRTKIGNDNLIGPSLFLDITLVIIILLDKSLKNKINGDNGVFYEYLLNIWIEIRKVI